MVVDGDLIVRRAVQAQVEAATGAVGTHEAVAGGEMQVSCLVFACPHAQLALGPFGHVVRKIIHPKDEGRVDFFVLRRDAKRTCER